jgi:DNA-binding MarR family transcriptional regulator
MDKLLTQGDYQALAELRHGIREFLHFSEQASRAAGLEPRQHQFMLALKGLPAEVRPRIAELAERLKIQHHSAVELVNRLSLAGFVRRHRGKQDKREVLVSLTPKGEKILRELSLHHRTELQMRGPALVAALRHAMQPGQIAKSVEGAVPSKKTTKTG